jgi:glucose-6-phosphate 1-dehydrogenase
MPRNGAFYFFAACFRKFDCMFENKILPPTIIFIFGGSGDLSHRKLVPALFNLFFDGLLPEKFALYGLGRTVYTDEEYRNHLLEGARTFSRRKEFTTENWNTFAEKIRYLQLDVAKSEEFKSISEIIHKTQQDFQAEPAVIFYLAVAPSLTPAILQNMGKVPACHDRKNTRIVIEKPFGSDLESARELNKMLYLQFSEEQIFRIDHYLGKETVQNILAFRFANALFEPIWNKNYIDHIQITAAETVGMEKRGDYYERSGALRDMVQNHLLQLMCMIAMEPPLSLDALEIRNKKADVLRGIRRIKPDEVNNNAVRGQYSSGMLDTEPVHGYREEEKVDPGSSVETFVAVKLFIDNWRWQNVPFYMRTGKRMKAKTTVISVIFKQPPEYSFPTSPKEKRMPNRITFSIQPDADIRLRFQAKKPGTSTELDPVNMVFTYKDAFREEEPEAYETLLLDVMEGDATLFMRIDQVEEAWKVIMPILDEWKKPPADFPNYKPGSWGPDANQALMEKDGRRWVTLPLPLKEKNSQQV